MRISRLRLVGFKSFVEVTELAIEPGLTGIVGPNGCGKSNLVEALRWVMGEASAKRLRGGEMDDVVFAGTAARPARNIAEVALMIDNSGRDAPFAFNDREEIEVVRHIERGGGSTYRVNGREVRARDVQLLFADAASGAHSGGMVSQGRIGALIEAKPIERKLLLEEAAGTAGLHARRRETELKLGAAEENLSRLDDVIATIASQFEGLKKQARQAQRYRRLAEQIRRTEALLFCGRWFAAQAEAERSAIELRTAEAAVAEAAEQALCGRREREAAEAALPPLRSAEAASAADLQQLTQARSALEQELQRMLAARKQAEGLLVQIAADYEREQVHLADAEAALTRLSEERLGLIRTEEDDQPAPERAAARLREHSALLAQAEAALQHETEAAAAAQARRAGLEWRHSELIERRARLEARRAEAEAERAVLAAALIAPEALSGAVAEVGAAEQQLAESLGSVETCERMATSRLAQEQAALDRARETAARLARLKAEADGLRALLATASDSGGTPILASLRVAPGFEAAVGAAFGDELLAPLADSGDPPASRFWVDLGGDGGAGLPDGARPLAQAVAAPPALTRSLAQAGWVENTAAGHSLQAGLAPGQRLVDRDGRLWRWDGFTALEPNPSPAAQQLRHKSRLAALEAETTSTGVTVADAEQNAAVARAERKKAAEAERLARRQLSEANAALARARTAEAELSYRALSAKTRLAASAALLEKLAADLAEVTAKANEAEHDLTSLTQLDLAGAGLEQARAAAVEARRDEAAARVVIDRLARESAERDRRLSSIDLEERSWRNRSQSSAAQLVALQERHAALETEIAGLAARPAAIAVESEALVAALAEAAAACRRSSDDLAFGETRAREAAERSDRADQMLAGAREQLARLEVLRDGADEALARLARDILERLAVSPESLYELAGTAQDAIPADPAETAARLDRLTRERDGMGPVNLIAEAEAAEVEARIAELQRERTDLTEAIARLRSGLATLDHEVRRRLMTAFEHINGHFSVLCTRLFGGGRAHLALVDSDDPLAAGLEIMASPPGKKMQSLSLLSGGEQALTALALLFAAFLTNPAPICVLDEVDAPLDDANVDRFCSLVGEIADTTGTRFLLVTHHPITMARADRLFGVTMTERGVSQLVSVDLARAARLRQSA